MSESLPDHPTLSFPLQFSANISITAHQIEQESEYPPRVRTMTIFYDYLNKKARIDIDAGYEAAKTHIRRYDTKQEYMIRLPPINDCKRSFLSELMVYPTMPVDAVFVSENAIINGIPCNQYLFEEIETRVHFYMSKLNNAPVQLILESFDGYESTQMLTYDYYNVTLAPPAESLFSTHGVSVSESGSECEEHRGGFPYIHIFHYFVRV